MTTPTNSQAERDAEWQERGRALFKEIPQMKYKDGGEFLGLLVEHGFGPGPTTAVDGAMAGEHVVQKMSIEDHQACIDACLGGHSTRELWHMGFERGLAKLATQPQTSGGFEEMADKAYGYFEQSEFITNDIEERTAFIMALIKAGFSHPPQGIPSGLSDEDRKGLIALIDYVFNKKDLVWPGNFDAIRNRLQQRTADVGRENW